MIKQDQHYIKNKKKTLIIKTLLWTGIILGIFSLSWYFTGQRGNYFTVLAALLVLPLAQNLTRYISFSRFKDPKSECTKVLEQMKGSYVLYHSAIIPDTRETLYFQHLVVTSRNIYLLSERKEMVEKGKGWLTQRFNAKGIELKNIHFIYADGPKALKNASVRIEKDACYTSEELNNRTAIIEGMLM